MLNIFTGFIPNSVIKSEVLKYLEKQASNFSVPSERVTTFSYIATSSKSHTSDSSQKPRSSQEKKKRKKLRKMSSSVLDTREVLSDTNLFKIKDKEFRIKNDELREKKKVKKTVRISARSKSEKVMFKKHKKIKRLKQSPGKQRLNCMLGKDTTSDSERYPGSSASSSIRRGSDRLSTASSKQIQIEEGMTKRRKLRRKPGGIFEQPGTCDLNIQSSQEGKISDTFDNISEYKHNLPAESDEITSPERRGSRKFQDLVKAGTVDIQKSQKESENLKKKKELLDFFKTSDTRKVHQVQSLVCENSLKEKYKSMIGILSEHSTLCRHPCVEGNINDSLYGKTQRRVDGALFKASTGIHVEEAAARSSVYKELCKNLSFLLFILFLNIFSSYSTIIGGS